MIRLAAAAVLAATVSTGAFALDTTCSTPQISASGTQTLLLYKGFFGKVPGNVSVGAAASSKLDEAGATRATLSVRCDVGDKSRIYRNPVPVNGTQKFFYYNPPKAPNRSCDKVTSVFIRTDAPIEAAELGQVRVCVRG